MPYHTVVQGEYIEKIAKLHKLTPAVLWDHPQNAELKRRRGNSNILYPGDEVFIPETELKEIPCATDKRHTFCCQSRKVEIKLRFRKRGAPKADERYVLTVGNFTARGTLDSDGCLRVKVPIGEERGTLLLGRPGHEQKYTLQIGHMDPLDEVQGIRKRLKNMGYYSGPAGESNDAATRSALARFQGVNGLQVTGEIDDATRERLRGSYEW